MLKNTSFQFLFFSVEIVSCDEIVLEGEVYSILLELMGFPRIEKYKGVGFYFVACQNMKKLPLT
jgi:hypothetical protein